MAVDYDKLADKYGGIAEDVAAAPAPITAGAPPSDAPLGEPGPNMGHDVLPWLIAGGTGAMHAASGIKKELGIGAGAVGAWWAKNQLQKRFGGGQPPAGPPPGAPPPGTPPEGTPVPFLEPKPDKGYVTLTPEDIAQHEEFAKFPPGYEMDRKTYQEVKMGRLKPVPPGRSVKRAMARAEEPVRPITMEGQPANAPAGEPPNGPGVGRGKSGPRLAREAGYRAERAMSPQPEGRGKVLPFLQESAPPGEVNPVAAQRAMARLPMASRVAAREALRTVMSAEASAAEKAAAQAALRSVLGELGGGALMVLPFLLDAARGTNPIDEAAPLLEQFRPGGPRPMINVTEEAKKAGMTEKEYIAWVRGGRKM